MRFILVVAFLGVLSAAPGFASDGVLEINQTCAVETGCFPGDAPGFPVTITTPGSYRLTSNLSLTATTSSAIVVSPSGVSLDLNGFEVAGPGTCNGPGFALTCTLSNGASGIRLLLAGGRSRVLNGTIRGFGGIGVEIGSGSAERLRVAENAAGGIVSTFIGPSVIDSVVERNKGDGVKVLQGIVRGCTIANNSETGLVGQSGLYENNLVQENGTGGINGSLHSSIQRNVVIANGGDGILVTRGALVADNVSAQNGLAGISAVQNSSIQRNVVSGNAGVGLYLSPDLGGSPSAYSNNDVVGNFGGTVVNGTNMGGNSCLGTATCP